jgi:hypothetical protein
MAGSISGEITFANVQGRTKKWLQDQLVIQLKRGRVEIEPHFEYSTPENVRHCRYQHMLFPGK